jgi:hypothetical protein
MTLVREPSDEPVTRRATDQTESPTCLLTPNGTVQDVNDAFCRLLSHADTVLSPLLEITESQTNDLTFGDAGSGAGGPIRRSRT